jgi:hypothetical protein
VFVIVGNLFKFNDFSEPFKKAIYPGTRVEVKASREFESLSPPAKFFANEYRDVEELVPLA